MRVPGTARRSYQSIPEEINPEYSLEGLMLKLQYFGCLMQKADTLEKTLMYRTVFWTLLERERVGRFGRMALKRV